MTLEEKFWQLFMIPGDLMELKQFGRIHLAPGERRSVVFTLAGQDLRMLDSERRWVVEPGAFRVMIGSSSKDIRLRGQIIIR
jgi:beta-glucosidase